MKNINDVARAKASLQGIGSGKEAYDAYQRAKADLNAEYAKNKHDEKWHREQAAVLSERLDYGLGFGNLYNAYFPVETLGKYDVKTIRERRGLQVFSTARGGLVEESQITENLFEVGRDHIAWHVSEHEDVLDADYAEALESMATMAEQRMDAEINRRIYSMLQAAVPVGHPSYVAGLASKSAFDQTLVAAKDSIKPVGGRRTLTIAGRAGAIQELMSVILPAGVNDPSGQSALRETGFVTTYHGANVIEIQNDTDENDLSYIADDEVWVMGGTVGVFCLYGGVDVTSWFEPQYGYRHIQGRQTIGGLVYHPDQARRIVL